MFGSHRKNKKRRPLRERLRDLGSQLGVLGRKAIPVAFLLAVAIGLPYGVFYAYIQTVSGSYFQLEQVDVSGVNYADKAALLKRAGLREGRNIFDVDVDRAGAAVEASPWVEHAAVDRHLPDRVSVSVTEYHPVAVLVGDGYHLINAEAVAFKSIEAGDTDARLWKLPLITGLQVDQLAKPDGRQLFLEAMDVADMYDDMEGADWESLSEIHLDAVLGMTLITADTGIEIRLGRGRYRKRLERLEVVQRAITRRAMEVDYILIDQESDLSRVAVGQRPQTAAAGSAHSGRFVGGDQRGGSQ